MTNVKRSKVSLFIVIVSFILTVATSVGIFVGIAKAKDTTTEVTKSMYTIGAISEDGKLVESKRSAYLEDMETVDGLVVELDEETATVSYKLAFYDEEGNFISKTEEMKVDFDGATIPSNAKFFRIEITPYAIDDEPVNLNVFNLRKYTKQISVSFNK